MQYLIFDWINDDKFIKTVSMSSTGLIQRRSQGMPITPVCGGRGELRGGGHAPPPPMKMPFQMVYSAGISDQPGRWLRP